MNPQIDVPLLTVLFTDSNQKKYDCTSDIHALNPLHYLARNPTIEMKILTLFLKVCPIAASMADKVSLHFEYLYLNSNIYYLEQSFSSPPSLHESKSDSKYDHHSTRLFSLSCLLYGYGN